MKILGNGIYDLAEAAQYTGLRRERIREWFKGRSGGSVGNPVFESDYEVINGSYDISFLDLVEVFVAGQLRDHGVSLQYIRRAHERLRRDWDTKHPFSKKDIRTNGKDIFACLLDDEEERVIYDVMSKNQVFESIIRPTLRKIDYAAITDMAEKWHLAPLVVLDPAVCYGKPIIEPVGITTRVIAESYFANNQNVVTVSKWYEIEEEFVRAAVSYEAGVAA